MRLNYFNAIGYLKTGVGVDAGIPLPKVPPLGHNPSNRMKILFTHTKSGIKIFEIGMVTKI